MTIRKTILVVSTIFIGVAVCLSVWFVLHKADSPSTHEHPTASDNDPTPEHAPRRNKLLDAEKAAQQIAGLMKADYLESGASDPQSEKLIEIMESPEFDAFLESKIKDPNPANLLNITQDYVDFLESQGFVLDLGSYKVFRAAYPTGEPADYEPEMRVRTAQLFLTTELVNPQDPLAERLQRNTVLAKLVNTEGWAAWYLGQFGNASVTALSEQAGNPAFEWLVDVQQNAQSIVAAAGETTRVDTPQAQQEAPSWDMSSVMESHSASDSETEMPTTPDSSASALMTDTEIDAAMSSQPRDIATPQRPDSPSDMEASLKAQFPSERFERAMDTLEQYGPEEGLRRLRESDPEVASQIERHRNRSGSEDFDKSEEEVSR